ncbi:hypothetical protein IC582_029301 [Cucumis melo]
MHMWISCFIYPTGEIPYELGYLQNLEYLAMQENFFNGTIPPTIFNLSKLNTIALVKNQLSGTLPANLGVGLPNLVQFILGRNKLTGNIPESITNSSMLTLFDVGDNSFSGLIPNVFGRFENLRWINLELNNFTTESPPSERSIFSFLTNLTSLVRLELSHNPLNIFLPSSFINFSSSFQYLSMVNTGIKGMIPKDIGNFLRSLTVLVMDDNQITGTIPTSIGKLKQLQGLHLSNNSLEGNIPAELCQLENLNELYLANNKLSGAIPACFDNLSALRTLSLGSNNLNSTMPSSLWSLSYILHLNLSSNSLRGSLPVEIGNLEVVLDIDVSKNQLSGEIPSSIGGLINLVNLSLSHNELEDSIPDSFGNLVNLEILDLSSNNLTGVIPKSLEKLSHLEQFNVSFNQLEGEIPSGGPFSNFSAQSFISNIGLCSASSRFQVAPCTTKTSQDSGRKTNKLVYILPPILLAMFSLILLLLFMTYRRRKKEQVREDTPLPYQPAWRRTTYQELSQATDGFSESNLIGRGSFGSVYKATLSDGTIAAVKIFNLLTQDANKSFELECEILCNIRHRNLVKIITSCSSVDFKALILEYMPNGNLDMWLYHHDCGLNMLERLNIMIDVALALDYLHNGYGKPIVHCDLKPNNILLDGDMVAHLTDFGISKLLGGGDSITKTITLATVGYMAPELGLDGIVSRKCDVYSYGILLMETFTRKKPTDEMFSAGEMGLREWIAKAYPHSINNVVDPNLLSDDKSFNYASECLSSIMLLALTCTSESPEKRASSKDVLNSLNKIKATFLTYPGW